MGVEGVERHRRTIAAVALAGCALVLAGAAALRAPSPHAVGTPLAPKSELLGHGLAVLPPDARSAISAKLGARSTAFRARATRDGFRLGGGGVTAHGSAERVSRGAGGLSLELAGLGRGTRIEQPGARSLHAEANRVSLDGQGVTEWYAAGPFGIEQGFTLPAPPAGGGPLR